MNQSPKTCERLKNEGKRKQRKKVLRCGTITIEYISNEGNLQKDTDEILMRVQCKNTFANPFIKQVHQNNKESEKYHNQVNENLQQKCVDTSLIFSDQSHMHLSSYSRIYLFTDIMIDMGYLKSIEDNNQNYYLKENAKYPLYHGIKQIIYVEHRHDNSCVEAYIEICLPTPSPDIGQTISILNSINNIEVNRLGQLYQKLLDLRNQGHRQYIQNDRAREYFSEHELSRRISSRNVYQEITSKLDTKKCIMYFYYQVNYQKELFEVSQIGFTPGLYNLLSRSSQDFIAAILKKGYYEPLTLQFRLHNEIEKEMYFQIITFCSLRQDQTKQYQDEKVEICTIDGHIIPANLSRRNINLHDMYDTFNNLNYQTNDMLSIFEFNIDNYETIKAGLKKERH